MGGLESYRGTDKKIDEVLRRKADIMKIVETYTGDGNFKVKLDKNPQTLRLDVRATGKSLSEVLPAGFVLPMAAVGMFTGRMKEETKAMPMPQPVTRQPAPPPPPRPAPKAPAPKPQPRP